MITDFMVAALIITGLLFIYMSIVLFIFPLFCIGFACIIVSMWLEGRS